ncbi:MAG TPA: methyltransferase domain-containing protein [Thermoplasmata archaeon]|nr:methyltransferase domain-containing protein [Thermoplasmata archaeon]
MPWTYSEEYYREYTRTTWNESAEAYVALMRNFEPFRSDLLDRLAPVPGERILDLGTGPGEPAMTIARSVADGGLVTGVDLSEKMVEIARSVARARGLANVRFDVMDCSSLTFPEASFDAVTSSFGFQIFTDPEKAAREAHRVLRPGGRICVCVWSTAERVPFLDVLVAPMLEHAEPDETGYLPTPYETGGPGEMVAFLESAGFTGGREETVTHPMRFESADAYLTSVLQATPLGHSLSEEDADVQAEVLRKTRANLRRWTGPAGVELPAESVVVLARKP